jgi:hypothetical protein
LCCLGAESVNQLPKHCTEEGKARQLWRASWRRGGRPNHGAAFSCRRRTSAATEWSRVSESADSGRGLLILKWYAVWASREVLCFARS